MYCNKILLFDKIAATKTNLKYVKLVVNSDNSAKAFCRVEKNYHPTQRYTVYYSPEKREIICPENKGERSVYNKLRKQLTK